MRPNIPLGTQLMEMYLINFPMVQTRYWFVASVTVSDIKHTKAVS